MAGAHLVQLPEMVILKTRRARVQIVVTRHLRQAARGRSRLAETLGRWAREAYPEVEAAFERARAALDSEMTSVEATLAGLDPTLRAAADAARGRALHQIETLHEKATRALKKRDQARADRLRRTRDALFPGGSFQERGLGLLGPLARHGTALVDEIRERMDPWARGRQVVYL